LVAATDAPVACPPPARHTAATAQVPEAPRSKPAAAVRAPVEGRREAKPPHGDSGAETPVAAPRLAGTPDYPFFVDVNDLVPNSRISDWFAAAITQKREETPEWDINNLGNWKSTCRLLTEAFGDRPLSWFTNARMLEFRSLLMATPKHHHRSSEAGSLYQIIEEAEAEEARNLARAENEIVRAGLSRGDAEMARARARIERLRVGTVYRHCQAVLFVFRLAADHGCADLRVMKNVLWTKKQQDKLKEEEKDMGRLAWGDKLKDLLGTSAFVSDFEDAVHAVFWPTLIAAHAGLRMEETLQLKTCDIDTVDGIAVFRIQSGEGQHLKSKAAKRIIPIHRNLIDLGFLIMVQEQRDRGQEWLFPDIERCAAKGKLSGTFTKVFTHYRIAEGVYDPRRDFHSLRTNFNVILKRQECPLDIRKRLIGHEMNDVTEEHYDPEGAPIAEFNKWVQMIDIDVSHIQSKWRTSAPGIGNVVSFQARG
jgi:integrase